MYSCMKIYMKMMENFEGMNEFCVDQCWISNLKSFKAAIHEFIFFQFMTYFLPSTDVDNGLFTFDGQINVALEKCDQRKQNLMN